MKKVSRLVIWFIYDIHFQSRVQEKSLKSFILNWGYLCKQTLRKKEKMNENENNLVYQFLYCFPTISAD